MRDDTRLSRCITPDGKSVDRCPLTGFAFLVYSYLVNLLTKKKSRQPSKQGQAQKDFKNEAQECHQSKGLIGLIILIVV